MATGTRCLFYAKHIPRSYFRLYSSVLRCKKSSYGKHSQLVVLPSVLSSFQYTGVPKSDYRTICTTNSLLRKPRATITFIRHDGTQVTAEDKVGKTLLDVIVDKDLDLKGYGACEGTLSCSTCHLIFKPEDFELLDGKATDEEMDMLDLALDVCETSRLGCQVVLTKEMDGFVVRVPAVVRDARENPTDAATT